MTSEYMTIHDVIEQLESCGYECESGRLEDNVAFRHLKRMAQVAQQAADERRQDIERIAEQACIDAQVELKPASEEPINWGDLHCSGVEYGYTAVIEEAAPGCNELIGFVLDRLSEAGYQNVNVYTEW